jgi:hypothetical protein
LEIVRFSLGGTAPGREVRQKSRPADGPVIAGGAVELVSGVESYYINRFYSINLLNRFIKE